MKYFIIHGEDSAKSYTRLVKFINEARRRDWEIVWLDDSQYSLPENITAGSLFSSNRFFIHRDFKKIPPNDLNWISGKSQNYEGNLVLYADSQLPKSSLNILPKSVKVEEFQLSKSIWSLLDSFYPGNANNIVKLLHQTSETEPIELVFEMLARLIRDIFIIKTDSSALKYPSWKLGKLKSQANKFDLELLIALISDFAVADVKSKSTDSKLLDLLDLIIIEKLK